jgi:hypothetical protein
MAIVVFEPAAFEAPTNNFDPLPLGEYEAMVINAEERETRAGNGTFIALTMEILGGKFSGRKVWENLNIINPNKVTVEIAHKNLKQLSIACGFPAELEEIDWENCVNIPFTLVLDIDRKDPTRNRVMGYKRAGSSAAPSSFAQTSATAAKPWERK